MNEIVKIRIQNELDIVLAYKRAKQLSEYTGMNISTQTKFATAISEICRNVLEHVGEGHIKIGLVEEGDMYLEALVSDRGRGISNLDEILTRQVDNINKKGCGIANSRKLVDQFKIESIPDNGTKVIMRKKIPVQHPAINISVIQGWKSYFEKEDHISPYEEIKKQNMQLMEVMETLQLKNLEAEEQLNEIKRLNSDLDKFAYTVSHDLKAPLKNIEAIITMVEESVDNKDPEGAKSSCGILKNQTLRMEKLINGILTYAKEGKQNIVKTQVDMHFLVCEVITTLNVPDKFTIEINPDLPILYTEEVLLNQIFSNLLSNAIKYHDKDRGSIRISYEKDETGLLFFVEDDGPGISEADIKKIFKIFQPLVPAEDSTGIGLSIVKNIVTEKGGRVWVESKGRGSKFLFSWPDKVIETDSSVFRKKDC